jgi:hypothetical protein
VFVPSVGTAAGVSVPTTELISRLPVVGNCIGQVVIEVVLGPQDMMRLTYIPVGAVPAVAALKAATNSTYVEVLAIVIDGVIDPELPAIVHSVAHPSLMSVVPNVYPEPTVKEEVDGVPVRQTWT